MVGEYALGVKGGPFEVVRVDFTLSLKRRGRRFLSVEFSRDGRTTHLSVFTVDQISKDEGPGDTQTSGRE